MTDKAVRKLMSAKRQEEEGDHSRERRWPGSISIGERPVCWRSSFPGCLQAEQPFTKAVKNRPKREPGKEINFSSLSV